MNSQRKHPNFSFPLFVVKYRRYTNLPLEMLQPDFEIVEVWASNLEEEFVRLSDLITRYHFVAMDTEFPGFIARSTQTYPSANEERFHRQRLDVNLMKIIQIGITLGDGQGNLCQPCTWQFNFKFNPSEDLSSPDAITLLQQADIKFEEFERKGIDVSDFAHLLLSSGLVMNDSVIWISFHGGYDFAYLLKILTGDVIPPGLKEFLAELGQYFPHFYDMKYIINVRGDRAGGLQDLANNMGVMRVGTQHQAGSDSYVTLLTYYRYMDNHFAGSYVQRQFENNLFGLSGK